MHQGCAGMRSVAHSGLRKLASRDRPDKWRRAASAGLHIDRDAPAATGGKTFDQSNQGLRTRRMIIGDAVHQLPGLLNGLVNVARPTIFSDVVLCLEQRKHESVE